MHVFYESFEVRDQQAVWHEVIVAISIALPKLDRVALDESQVKKM